MHRGFPRALDAEGFDAAIIAIGNIPFFPKWLTCKYEGRVVLVNDVDSGAAQVGNNIVIVGAGITGLETAYRFVQLGRKVTVVDMLPRDQIAQTNAPINAYALFNLLENYDWDLRCETKLVDVTDDAVIVSHDGKEERLGADSVIIAMAARPTPTSSAALSRPSRDLRRRRLQRRARQPLELRHQRV